MDIICNIIIRLRWQQGFLWFYLSLSLSLLNPIIYRSKLHGPLGWGRRIHQLHLVDMFICPFLDYNQCSHNYWHGSSCKVLLFQCLFLGLGIYLFYHILWLIYYYSLQAFHTSVNWLSFTGVWVTASLLKSPGLSSVFWTILTLLSGWSLLVIRFLSLLGPLLSF